MVNNIQNDTFSADKQLVMAKLDEEIPENRCLCWRCYQSQVHQDIPESLKRGQELLTRSLSEFRAKSNKHAPSLLPSYIFIEDVSSDGFRNAIDQLRNAIEQAEQERKKREKAIIRMFHRFCAALDSHSQLLSLIPSESIYCSLFCGAITCIVKASVNHQNITNGFSQAIEEISEDIQPATQILNIHDDPRLRLIVGDLYGHYFSFLADALDWYKDRLWKVLAISVNQNFYNQVYEKVVRIRRITQMMFRQANIRHMEMFRDEAISTRAAIREMNMDLRERTDLILRALAEKSQDNTRLFELLSEQIRKCERLEAINNQLIREVLRRWKEPSVFLLQNSTESAIDPGEASKRATMQRPNQLEIPIRLPNDVEPSPAQEVEKLVESGPPREYTVVQIRENASPMMKHISNVCRFMSDINLTYAHEDTEIQIALSDWLAISLPVMWLSERSVQDSYPSPGSEKAARVIQFSIAMGIPTIAFFCRYPYDYNPTTLDVGAEQCLTDLVYNVIRQLVDFLPTNFTASTDLTQQRFSELESGYQNLQNAFGLLSDLLFLAPSILLFVIDGIDHLDLKHVTNEVDQLLNVFMGGIIELKKQNRGVVKILFTTTRDSEALQRLSLTHQGCMRRMSVASIGGKAGVKIKDIFDM